MTLQIAATPDGGFGTDLAFSSNGRWVAARTGSVTLWSGDDLVATTSVPGYRRGTPAFTDDGSTVGVGVHAVTFDQASVVGGDSEPGWLTAGIDDPDVEPSQFAPAAVAASPGAGHAVVLTEFLPTRSIDARDTFEGPRSQLLLVDMAANELVTVLVADAAAQRPVLHASASTVAAATTREVAAWTMTGEPIGCWAVGEIVDAVAVHPGGDLVAALIGDGEIVVHTTSGDEVGRFDALPDAGAALAWDQAGTRLAAVSRDGAVGVWSVRLDEAGGGLTVDELGRTELDPDSGAGIAFGPGQDEITVASDVVDQVLTRLRVD